MREGGGGVVFGDGVLVRVVGCEPRLVRVKVRLVDRFRGPAIGRNHRLAGRQFHPHFAQQRLPLARLPHQPQFPLSRLGGAVVVQNHTQIERLSPADVGRNGDFFDRDIGPCRQADGNHIDPHPGRGGTGRLLHGVPQVLVPVGDDHHPFGRIFGKQGQSHVQGRFQIGEFPVDLGFDATSQWEVVVDGANLHVRLAAKHNHRRAVAAGRIPMLVHRPPRILHHRLPRRTRDALGLVQQINHRQPVADPHQPHVGDRQDQQQHDQRPPGNRHHATDPPQAGEAVVAEHPQQGQEAGQQQVPGRVENETVTEHRPFTTLSSALGDCSCPGSAGRPDG